MYLLFFLLLQASYLVGVSDPHSQSGHEGLVDPIQFARAHQAIQMACQNLVDPASSPSQVSSRRTRWVGPPPKTKKRFCFLGFHRALAVMSLPIMPYITHQPNQNEPTTQTAQRK